MRPAPNPRLVSVAEAACRTGLSTSTIRAHRACGILEAATIDGRTAVTEDSLHWLLIALAERRRADEQRRRRARKPTLRLVWTNPEK